MIPFSARDSTRPDKVREIERDREWERARAGRRDQDGVRKGGGR